MAYASVSYPASGVDYTITFPYLDVAHVEVLVDGVLKTRGTDYTIPTTGRVTFNTAPTGLVTVRRNTPKNQRVVDFSNGSLLHDSNLDKDSIYNLYIVQEAFDALEASIQPNYAGSFDVEGQRIINVADPVDAQDVATKNWSETSMSAQVAQGIAARTAAEAARDTSQGYRDETLVAKTAAETAQTASETARDVALQAQSDTEGAAAQNLLDIQAEGDTQVARVVAQGDTEVSEVQAAGQAERDQIASENTQYARKDQENAFVGNQGIDGILKMLNTSTEYGQVYANSGGFYFDPGSGRWLNIPNGDLNIQNGGIAHANPSSLKLGSGYEMVGLKMVAIQFEIWNDSGVLKHSIKDMYGSSAPIWTNPIANATSAYTATPTVGPSTDYLSGAGIAYNNSSSISLDIPNMAGFYGSMPIIASVISKNGSGDLAHVVPGWSTFDVNGASQPRLLLSLRDSSRNPYAITTTNIPTGNWFRINVFGWMPKQS